MRLSTGKVRKLRRTYDLKGHGHEFTFSCWQNLPLLKRERTCRWVVEAIEQARRHHDFQLWAFVIMPTHVHMIVFRPGAPLGVSDILKAMKQSVSRKAASWMRQNAPLQLPKFLVKRKDGREVFRFWQPGGGYDRNLITLEAIWNSVEYIHMNPVKAGLCQHPTDWIWSSARWYAKRDDCVLACDSRPKWLPA